MDNKKEHQPKLRANRSLMLGGVPSADAYNPKLVLKNKGQINFERMKGFTKPIKPKVKRLKRLTTAEKEERDVPIITPPDSEEEREPVEKRSKNEVVEERMKMYPSLVDNGLLTSLDNDKKKIKAKIIECKAEIFKMV